MFNLLQSANDDQTAIFACLLTIVGASIIVFASYHLGPAGQKQRDRLRKRTNMRLRAGMDLESGHAQDRAA